MISLRPSLITEHHSVSSQSDPAREASPCSRYLRPARDVDTTGTVGRIDHESMATMVRLHRALNSLRGCFGRSDRRAYAKLKGVVCGRDAPPVEWGQMQAGQATPELGRSKRRELHPRSPFRKSFRGAAVAKSSHPPVRTPSAKTRRHGSLSRTGTHDTVGHDHRHPGSGSSLLILGARMGGSTNSTRVVKAGCLAWT